MVGKHSTMKLQLYKMALRFLNHIYHMCHFKVLFHAIMLDYYSNWNSMYRLIDLFVCTLHFECHNYISLKFLYDGIFVHNIANNILPVVNKHK